jgi:glycosyltransferase involved in cell wall biosynthesis
MKHASSLLRDDAPHPALSAERIAVLIPCYNEEISIGSVVSAFRAALPHALIYVYDNNSRDASAAAARGAGAIVRREPLQGKGHVVRRMFADIDADVYVLVDGDDTYDASSVAALVEHLLENRLDLVNGARVTEGNAGYRWGHRWGNAALTRFVSTAFGRRFDDMLSGYKVFSRRFVKSFPALSSGFEIETELTVHALQLDMPVDELPTRYKDRPEGSTSKLNTWRDGWRILVTIVLLIKEERPLAFFGALCAALTTISLVLAWPLLVTYLATGLVPRLPTALLATGLVILGFLSLTCGLILDSVACGRREMRRLHYLAQEAPRALVPASSRFGREFPLQ